ncbi:MAG: SDR family oxidoreductase [Chloroflexota bacterium]|nr:SDR family oxidoreductase [Chloroflexota bacterium]
MSNPSSVVNLTLHQQQWRRKYGPWALVTGASDGIGREFARDLAKRGLNLILVARRRPLLQQLADELTRQHRVQTQVIDADLAQDAEVERVLAATKDMDIGLLVASAGFGTSGSFINAHLDQELNMLAVNCRAVLMMTHHFGQRLARRKRGGIVLFGSLVGFQGVPNAAHYAATKAYIQSLAEGLHVELSPLGVDVLASAPGPVDSGFASRANLQMQLSAKPDTVAAETLDALGRYTTVRPGRVSKLLELALTLLPRSRRVHMMGRIMGGMTQHQTQFVSQKAV